MLVALVVCLSLIAQDKPTDTGGVRIVTSVTEIIVPVTVYDRDDRFVNGLVPRDFRLFDNEREQNIKVTAEYQPISLVVCVQANRDVGPILPQVRKIGSMIENLVVGDQGEAAVIAFDHRIMVKQEFTNDVAKISEALVKVAPGSSSSRMIDAVQEATRMLRNRAPTRRRLILLLSEARDVASEGRGKETLIELQLANVTVYTVNMSRLVSTVMKEKEIPRPDPLPPAARSMPSNVPATPTSVAQKTGNQGGSFDAIPLMVEIFRDVKAVFKDNPAEVFTKGTGGVEHSFLKQKALEEAIAKIGEEVHSQYLITYSPNNTDEGGFHVIQVRVPERQGLKIRTRPGYWLAAR